MNLSPLVLTTIVLAIVGTTGVLVDVRALLKHETRTFGVSALIIKAVLTFGLFAEAVHFRALPAAVYARFGDDFTFLSLVILGVPLVAIAIGCELVALSRLNGAPPRPQLIAEKITED